MIRSLIPTGSKVLIAPLNWGLGHATRSIPIIKELLTHNCKVAIASDNEALALLQIEFPQLDSYSLPGYEIQYAYKSMAANMLMQLPKITRAYKLEYKEVLQLQKEHQWDFIISDGRYGVRAPSAKCFFISHQLKIQSWNPLAASLATKVNKKLINKFDGLWIPDEENHLLSGDLSNTSGIDYYRFLGVLSRMRPLRIPIRYDISVVLSGPEPVRTHLEKKLVSFFKGRKEKVAFVRGVDTKDKKHLTDISSTIDFYGRLPSEKLNQIISSSNLIICRAGYSSIMDLYKLHKKAILIPTPGQTEQEYLATHLEDQVLFSFVSEKNLAALSEQLS